MCRVRGCLEFNGQMYRIEKGFMAFSWLVGFAATLVGLFVPPTKLYVILFVMCCVGIVLQFCFCCVRSVSDHDGIHYHRLDTEATCVFNMYGLCLGSLVGILACVGGLFTLAAAIDKNHALLSV